MLGPGIDAVTLACFQYLYTFSEYCDYFTFYTPLGKISMFTKKLYQSDKANAHFDCCVSEV
jgi:hypothetical protein